MDEEFEEALRKTSELDERNRSDGVASTETFGLDDSMAAVRLRIAQSKAERKEQSNKLRKVIAYIALFFVGSQMLWCNVLVTVYVRCNIHTVDPYVIVAWMGASLVEVVGILWVIARSLFPFRDKYRNVMAEKNAILAAKQSSRV